MNTLYKVLIVICLLIVAARSIEESWTFGMLGDYFSNPDHYTDFPDSDYRD